MNPIDKEIERAMESVTLTQDAKYRIKNKIKNSTWHAQKHPHRKLSTAAVFALTLVSLLVISAAAIGGLSYFKAIYGEKAETLTPYGITIGTNAQNEDVILTLHESVADDYATAYIFSIKGLTDAGKVLVAYNTLDSDVYETIFNQTNRGETHLYTVLIDNHETFSVERTPPEENADCQLYELHQQINSDGEYLYYDIGLRRNNVMYDAKNNASYIIIPIKSLREDDCEYYALYIIAPEAQQLTLTFDDLELPLPEETKRILGTEVTISGYIQDYLLTEGGLSKIMSEYPTSAVLTPLGLYVDDNHTRSGMYKSATLVFNDGTETELSRISKGRAGIVNWKPSYIQYRYQGAAYLFNEIMDISIVKSLVFYDEIEFPFNGGIPFVRSSGRSLKQISPKALLWTIAAQIRDYAEELCPDTWIVTYQNESYPYSGWSSVSYVNDDTLSFKRQKQNHERDAYFTISMTETTGGTLEDEANAMVADMNIKHHAYGYENDLTFTVTGTGTYDGTEILVVECGETNPGLYKRCLFALYEGKLLTIAYDGYTGQPNDYAFDALLDLITF